MVQRRNCRLGRRKGDRGIEGPGMDAVERRRETPCVGCAARGLRGRKEVEESSGETGLEINRGSAEGRDEEVVLWSTFLAWEENALALALER